MTLNLGWLPKDQRLPGVPQSHPVSHLAHEVRQVEHGHDEDGQPLAQHAVADFGLQAREQAQCNEVGDRNGQHVGPDDPRHNISVQQQGWGNRGALEGDAVSAFGGAATHATGPHGASRLPLKVGQLRLTRG